MINKYLMLGTTDHTPVNAPCSGCRCDRQHEVLRSVRQKIVDDMDSITTDYQIVLCLTCKSPSLRMQVVDTDLFFFDEQRGESVTHNVVKSFS